MAEGPDPLSSLRHRARRRPQRATARRPVLRRRLAGMSFPARTSARAPSRRENKPPLVQRTNGSWSHLLVRRRDLPLIVAGLGPAPPRLLFGGHPPCLREALPPR